MVPKIKGFVSTATLLDLLDEFLKDNGHAPLPAGARRRASSIMLNLLARTFELFIRQGREAGKGVRGIVGVRVRNVEKDQEF